MTIPTRSPAWRVALVIGQLSRGGTEQQLVELARGLTGTAYAPVVICLSDVTHPHGEELTALGVPVHVVPRRRRGELRRVGLLIRAVRDERVHLIHAFLEVANAYTFGATRVVQGVPWIASMRNCVWASSPVRRALDKMVLRRAPAVVVNSARGASFLAEGGVYPRRVAAIPNGLAMDRFASQPDPCPIKQSLGIPRDAPVVGTVGLLKPHKQPQVFVDVARRVHDSCPEAHFVWAGDGALRRECEALTAADRRLREVVHWVGDRDDIPQLLAAYDVFVLTSAAEGLPNAVMEAMAAERPVVATAAGGVPELVRPRETGSLVPLGDGAALAREVIGLLADPERRRQWGRAGRRLIHSQYSTDAMVAATVALYDDLVDRPPGPSA